MSVNKILLAGFASYRLLIADPASAQDNNSASTEGAGQIVEPDVLSEQRQFPKPPPLPSPQNTGGRSKDPQIDYLARKHGISSEEAAERAEILRQVQQIVDIAAASDPGAFAGLWVDQEPTFKIVVSFAGQEDRRALLDRLPANLRRYVQIKSAGKSLVANQKDLDEILQTISVANIAFEVYFDPRSQNYVVTVKDQADAVRARGLVPPSLRSMVNVRVGPVLRTFQTNVRSGDAVYGAWDLVNSSGTPTCTYGFAGRNTYGRDAMLTAAHCSTSPPYVVGTGGGHLVQLPADPAPRYGDLYDFRIHSVAGLMTGYWVYYKNSKSVYRYPQYVNTVSGFYGDGYFTVKASLKKSTSYNSNHYLGMPVCKSGFATGFTCGTVQSNWVSGVDDRGVTYKGFVRVGGSSQPVIAWGGDSGGPVFSFPDSAYDIIAYGILKGRRH